MEEQVRRVFVEKKAEFAVEAEKLLFDLRENLGISGLEKVRIINRYDVSGLTDAEYQAARYTVFAEPPVDLLYDESLSFDQEKGRLLAVEYLPGQYDQRADSAAQCLQILTEKERPLVRVATLFFFAGELTNEEFEKIKEYSVNPVESREAALEKPSSLEAQLTMPANVLVLKGFTNLSPAELADFCDQKGLAMSLADLEFCQRYFRDEEGRDPSITEIKVIDTYWSDHCRHTTFLTEINKVDIQPGPYTALFERVYAHYQNSRQFVYQEKGKPVCLMDLATIAMKELKKQGKLPDLDESEEINACSIAVTAEVDGKPEEWLVMFKNETHNHPTEIEPFGGAATCLGGAIRDPLSGRSYVYQAMRVTGSGDPRTKIADTLPGKLPQRKITNGAAAGYSSYGNQIGLATGQVAEVYHPDFVAKRMEIGAVIGAAPRANVVRQKPEPGDIIILLGGRTGRDGCGGATGSSKEHTEESLYNCGAEVQKGNPPTERKIQRLFRDPRVSQMIKKCNDFGAGGVAVAIGELADGLVIELAKVPKKYEGLDGTELAISESQERMAVVINPDHLAQFIAAARAENLEATPVAKVTANPRLKMLWRDKEIVDLSRAFLNTNGVRQHAEAVIVSPEKSRNVFKLIPEEIAACNDLETAWLANLKRLNVCGKKGLVERFDSTIGSATVFMPFGGKCQLTPEEGMVAKLPVLKGETKTSTLMTYGYDPDLAKWSPFHGAFYGVIEAVAKIVALGGDYRQIRLTLQEYFEKLGDDPRRWGKPLGALLGAYLAQKQLGIPAIGGKDSMSGTFKELNVPPTLVTFAVAVNDVSRVISSEFKKIGSQVVVVSLPRNVEELPDFNQLQQNYLRIHELINQGVVLAARSIRIGGLAAAISEMCFGNKLGFVFQEEESCKALFTPDYGSIILEMPAEVDLTAAFAGIEHRVLGRTTGEGVLQVNEAVISLEKALASWSEPLETIFPTRTVKDATSTPPDYNYQASAARNRRFNIAKPRVFIPVFPGTNCEYDTQRAFEAAGALVEQQVFCNLTATEIEATLQEMVRKIAKAQIIMLPGGFSAGDEPDGSGKFIATAFRNGYVRDAVMSLLQKRDGLMLGICNGFQALIKLGLVPYGEIREIDEFAPTLTFNSLGRHVSCLVQTKISSNLSPWLSKVKPGEIHTVAVSHGEGRFIASGELLAKMERGGQIATQYVDLAGKPSQDIRYNPNGSVAAIEGITSPDGRVLGKMGHSERSGSFVAQNVPGVKEQQIFAAGVEYFA